MLNVMILLRLLGRQECHGLNIINCSMIPVDLLALLRAQKLGRVPYCWVVRNADLPSALADCLASPTVPALATGS